MGHWWSAPVAAAPGRDRLGRRAAGEPPPPDRCSRAGSPVSSANPAHRGDLVPRHQEPSPRRRSGVRHVAPTTDVHADVGDRGVQCDEVARLQLGLADAAAHPRLLLG
jgi:hypothetical protein